MSELICPMCGSKNVEYRELYYNLPYVGKALIYSFICRDCGYRKRDIILLEIKEPKRYILKVEKEEDLFIKIVRSSTAKIILQEVGIEINPGIAAEVWINNVEGLIMRVIDIVKMAKRFREEEGDMNAARKANEIIDYLEGVLQGKNKLTIIIEDKYGNSAILSEKATVQPL